MAASHSASGVIADVIVPKGTSVFSTDQKWPRQGKPTPRKLNVQAHPFRLGDDVVYWEVGNHLRSCRVANLRFPEKTVDAIARGRIK